MSTDHPKLLCSRPHATNPADVIYLRRINVGSAPAAAAPATRGETKGKLPEKKRCKICIHAHTRNLTRHDTIRRETHTHDKTRDQTHTPRRDNTHTHDKQNKTSKTQAQHGKPTNMATPHRICCWSRVVPHGHPPDVHDLHPAHCCCCGQAEAQP